ncbi:MAG TPA: hypothetical protein VGF98_02180 [Candidatus Tumulicola sp.]|jgi:hypothetical protein
MASTCVFCGKGGVTKEHLFAKWVRDTFYDPSLPSPVFDLQRDAVPVWSYSGDHSLEHTVKAFCAACNNGWMSRLEVQVAKILQPMLKAERVGIKLGYTAQLTVASWATKTALVLHQLHPAAQSIPSSYYSNFYQKAQPSSDTFVLIGARHNVGNAKGSNIFENKDGGRNFGSGCSIVQLHYAIGALYLAVILFIGRSRRYPRAINGDAAGRAMAVWPIQHRDVVWPSPSISDAGGIDGMFDAFTGAFWG